MKSLLRSLLLAVAVTGSVFAETSANDPEPVALNVVNASLSKGMNREAVLATLGAPNDHAGARVWIYWNYRAPNAAATARAETLVILFSDDRVSGLRLAEKALVAAWLKDVRGMDAPPATVIARK